MQVFDKPLSAAERTEIAHALRYALRYGPSPHLDRAQENAVIVEFMHALNRRRALENEAVEEAIQEALKPMEIPVPRTDQHTARTNPLNRWRSQPRF